MHTYPCEIKENHFSLRSPLHIYLFCSRFSQNFIWSFSIKTPWVSYTNSDRLCFRSFYQMVNIFNPCLTEKYIHQIHQILNYIKKLLNTCLHLNGRRDDLDPQSSHNLFMYLEQIVEDSFSNRLSHFIDNVHNIASLDNMRDSLEPCEL